MGCHKCLIYTRILIYIGTIVLHAINVLLMLHSFQGEPMKVEAVKNFGQMQVYFLTYWNFAFQMLYAAFAIYCDCKILKHIKDTSEKKPELSETLMNFREKVYTVTVWPATLLVFTYFWVFYICDRSLIYPEYIDEVISSTSNHIMHTLILPIALLELVVYPRRKPDSNLSRLCCIYGLEALYLCVIFYAHKTTGLWAYPIFGKMKGTLCLPTFILTIAMSTTVFYYLQFWISSIVFNIRERIGRKYCRAYMSCN